jgi:hypothetical protein
MKSKQSHTKVNILNLPVEQHTYPLWLQAVKENGWLVLQIPIQIPFKLTDDQIVELWVEAAKDCMSVVNINTLPHLRSRICAAVHARYSWAWIPKI